MKYGTFFLLLTAFIPAFELSALAKIKQQWPRLQLNRLADKLLLQAASRGQTTGVQEHISKANPDARDENGVTPLMFASYNGFKAIAQILLKHQANANLVTLSNKNFDFGKLLSHKNSKATALMLAAFAGKCDIVYALIKAGAALNAQDSDGQTALMYAILGDQNWPHKPLSPQRKKIIALLLEYGADSTIADHNGLDAAYYYSVVAGLVPGFGGRYDRDPELADEDPLYRKMK